METNETNGVHGQEPVNEPKTEKKGLKKKEQQEKKPLTPKQLQRRQKMLVYPLLALLFIGAMWLIFVPSVDDKAKQEAESGFNTELPAPNEKGLIGDKKTAYEEEDFRRRQEEKMRSLQDFSFLSDGENEKIDLLVGEKKKETGGTVGNNTTASRRRNIQSSAEQYRRVENSLKGWESEPKADVRRTALEEKVRELEEKLSEKEDERSEEERRLELIEKSYQMATRYAGGGTAVQGAFTSDKPYERVKAEAVTPVRHDVVSTLSLPPDDETFVEEYSKPRNYGFLTAAGGASTVGKNSIRAEVYGKTTITGGQDVRLRLLEPVKVGTYIVPAGTLITAQAKIASERLFVSVTSLQHGGNIIPVHLEAYGLDGVRGMFVPGSEELSAASDIAANMGTSLGTSVTISRDATSAIAADLGKSVIQGTSQYIAKKFRTVKVTLRAGHKLLLLPADR